MWVYGGVVRTPLHHPTHDNTTMLGALEVFLAKCQLSSPHSRLNMQYMALDGRKSEGLLCLWHISGLIWVYRTMRRALSHSQIHIESIGRILYHTATVLGTTPASIDHHIWPQIWSELRSFSSGTSPVILLNGR